MKRTAEISECGKYRWWIQRRWAEGPLVCFVMLNPSRADAEQDDPTIRRCIAYAQAWGFGALSVTMKIKSIAPWFGSKRTLAPRIVQELGPHSCYWEPFCGSCAVLFAKPPATYESVNDLHKDLVNLALLVQDETSAHRLYDRAGRTLFCEELMGIAKGKLTAGWDGMSGDEERAYWYLVFSWMALNGVSGTPLNHTGTFCARYSAKGGNGATRWRSVQESIPDWHERLRGVQILNRDAFELIEALDDAEGTSIYIDAPYVEKGAKYVHDFKPADHIRLADKLDRFKLARVVVSYYDGPFINTLYEGWTKVDCEQTKSMVQSGRRDKDGAKKAPEVLFINGPSLTVGEELELFT